MSSPLRHLRPTLRNLLCEEQGWGVIESLVGAVLLLIGLFGVLTMVDTGNQVTSQNLRREAGTNLAREVVERSRQVPYSSLASATTAASALAGAIPGAGAPASASWTTTRRGVQYTTSVLTCVMDEPADGLGAVNAAPCQPATGGGGGGGSTTPPPLTASLNVLGIPVNAALGGDALAAVCAALGQSALVDGLLRGTGVVDGLLGLVGGGADIGLCANGTTRVAFDRHPADLTRVTVTVAWQQPRPGRVVQSTLIPQPGGGS